MVRPILFEKLPELKGRIDWMELGEYPTPVERMTGLSESEGLSDFYVKRDDLSSPFYGGNKVRKLEFLLAHAKALGHSRTITFGAVGSNHVLATVIHGERVGMETIAVLMPQPNAAYVRKNLLADYRHGARFFVAESELELPLTFIKGMISGYDRVGMKLPYLIPPGGSNLRGCLGYVDGALELKDQVEKGLLPEPEFIFVTQGSSSTAAGLILGVLVAGLDSRVVPVRVFDRYAANRSILALHVENARRFIMRNTFDLRIPRVRTGDILYIDDFAGPRYAEFTPEAMEAVELAREADGIKLDGTYTGKTLAGALDFLHSHGLEKRPCLFWNTYNSVDIYSDVKDIDYHELPTVLHHYFEMPLQEEEMGYEVVF